MLDLPLPMAILVDPPPKLQLKCLIKKRVLSYYHRTLVSSSKLKSSLRFIKGDFLTLGQGPHPIWSSCKGSDSSIKAAIVHAKIFSGRYRDDHYLSKYSPDYDGSCSMPGCSSPVGDWVHWLSFKCSYLSNDLNSTYMLRP